MDILCRSIGGLIGLPCIIEKFTNIFSFNKNEQALKQKVEQLTNKMSDILNQLESAERSSKKRKKEVGKWLAEVEKLKNKCDELDATLMQATKFKALRYGDLVNEFKKEAEELINRSHNFGELVLDAPATSKERLNTTKLHGESFKRKLDEILEILKTESSIGIYGMGGVGKTALVRQVYTDLQSTPQGFYVCWVTASQEADINKMQHDLAKELKSDLSKDDDFEAKAAYLHHLLREKKKVVIIFDDAWQYYDLRRFGIPIDVDGCKVIITSRSREVCEKMNCKETFQVQPLCKEEAWGLFIEKLGHSNNLSLEIEMVAKEMANKCKGLPLAIITVARSMSAEHDIRGWRDALEELNQSIMGHQDMRDEVLPILLYSYNHLRDERMQKCFLYCSMYPEDYEIPRDELIEVLIRERLMHERGTRRAEFDQGHNILNKLVNFCLLDNVDYFDEPWGVKVHDLLREMAIEITRNNPKYMTKAELRLNEIPNEKEWTEDLDKVSLMRNEIAEVPEGLSPRCPRLSTLILEYNPLVLIPDCFFAQMQGLQVLNLRKTNIEELPNSISELEKLTALLLGGCRSLIYVPSLRKLKVLIELDLSDTKIEKLPEGIECLVKLKYLNMSGMFALVEFPSGLLSQFHRLQFLRLPQHIKVQVEEIESLRMLEKCYGWTNEVCNLNWFHKSPPLTSYAITAGRGNWGGIRIAEEGCKIKLKEYTFKKGGVGVQLKLPSTVKNLVINKCEDLSGRLLDILPSFFNIIEFQNIRELSLIDLENLIGLSMWEARAVAVPPLRDTFPSLRSLSIERCHKIKKLVSRNLLLYNFPNLERIWIHDCEQMEEIIADDDEVEEEDEGVGSRSSHNSNNPMNVNCLPKLRFITLWDLPKLESIYEKGTIECCDSIERIDIQKCRKLKKLSFYHVFVNENSPSPLTFPKLKDLVLCELPELRSVCDGSIMICDSIKYVEIVGCTKVSRLPFFLPYIDGQPSPPPSLKWICIRKQEREWWENLKWEHPNSINVLQPLLDYTEKKKMVFRLGIQDDKDKQKAVDLVNRIEGVESVTMDMNKKKMTVTGDVHRYMILAKLRELYITDFVSVSIK